MSGKGLLDTNIVIALFASELSVINRLKNTDEVFLSSIVLGELYYGVFKSANVEQNLSRISDFSKKLTVLSCDSVTAEFYGRIKSNLKEKGKPIPENDIWISALCKQYNLTLITRDQHFEEVEDILIERW